MVKKLGLIAFLFCLSFCCFAFDFTLRPQSGINLTNWSNTPSSVDFVTRVGWQIGVDGQFGNRLYLQTGIFYHETQSYLETSDGSMNREMFVDFISVSLGAGIKFIDPKITDMFNVRVFTVAHYSWDISLNPAFAAISTSDHLNQLNLGLGAGVDVWHFFLEVSGDVATRRVFENSSSHELENVKLNLIRVAVGGRFVF